MDDFFADSASGSPDSIEACVAPNCPWIPWPETRREKICVAVLFVLQMIVNVGLIAGLYQSLDKTRPLTMRTAVAQLTCARLYCLPAVYGSFSFLAYVFVNFFDLISAFASFWEGLALFGFFALLVVYLGGEDDVARILVQERKIRAADPGPYCLRCGLDDGAPSRLFLWNDPLRRRFFCLPLCLYSSTKAQVVNWRLSVGQWMFVRCICELIAGTIECLHQAGFGEEVVDERQRTISFIVQLISTLIMANAMLKFWRMCGAHCRETQRLWPGLSLEAASKFTVLKLYVGLCVIAQIVFSSLSESEEAKRKFLNAASWIRGDPDENGVFPVSTTNTVNRMSCIVAISLSVLFAPIVAYQFDPAQFSEVDKQYAETSFSEDDFPELLPSPMKRRRPNWQQIRKSNSVGTMARAADATDSLLPPVTDLHRGTSVPEFCNYDEEYAEVDAKSIGSAPLIDLSAVDEDDNNPENLFFYVFRLGGPLGIARFVTTHIEHAYVVKHGREPSTSITDVRKRLSIGENQREITQLLGAHMLSAKDRVISKESDTLTQ